MLQVIRKSKAVLSAIGAKAITLYKEKACPLATRLKEQEYGYLEIGLPGDRTAIQEKLNKCLQDSDFPPYNEDDGMQSEHLMIFAAIAMSNQYNPLNILEIGTYDGKTAHILSQLFPTAAITTIDLKDDDPIFSDSYGREQADDRRLFITQRNYNLAKGNNINFIQYNSLYLARLEVGNYDLIWVDGAHGYPVACCDITNSIRFLSKSGILMCDDVWIKIKKSDRMYSSTASWETLSEYDNAGITRTRLLRKRLGTKHLVNEKFVSFSSLR